MILGPHQLRLLAANVFKVPTKSSLLDSIRGVIDSNNFSQDILNHLLQIVLLARVQIILAKVKMSLVGEADYFS